MTFQPLKDGRIRLLYDPGTMSEASALAELHGRMPQLTGTRIVRTSRT